jgi:hypothetical protein
MTNDLTLATSGASAALDAFLSETEGLQGLLLPTVGIGDKVFVPNKGNSPADLDVLPDGSKARLGIFIAKRVGVLSWKTGFDTKGTEESPAFIAFAPDSNIQDVELVGQATKACQMKKKIDAPKWAFENSKVGFLKPILELLVYFPEVGFTVITTSPNYHDVVDGSVALSAIVNGNGELGLTAAMFSPEQKPHQSAAWKWVANFCKIVPADEKAKEKVFAQFAEYRDLISENISVKSAVDAWMSCSDRPVTPEIREALVRGVALNPPKF